MLRFENEVPEELRKGEVVVRTVGELSEVLARLPSELPLVGLFCAGAYAVSVAKVLESYEYLACAIESHDDQDDGDEDEFDQDFDD